MRWTWDPAKDAINRAKHGLPLSLGPLVLEDPLAVTDLDPHPEGDRWDTVGEVAGALFYVVHTWPDDDTGEGRVISVRKATPRERRAYHDVW